MEKEVGYKEEKGWKFFLNKFDNTKWTVNFLLIFIFFFLMAIIIISAIKGWIDQQVIINIGIMLIGLIVGSILSRKNGS